MTKPSVKIALTNPKSPTNVGAVIRAAGCYQANEIYYTGQRYERAAKYNTDTKNANLHIPLTAVSSILSIPLNSAKLVCVELVEGATALPEFNHPENAIYVFGAEDSTISQEVINKADHVVYIPTVGCMNLAATVNVVLYDRLAKSDNYPCGDLLIKSSRDTNNTVKVNQK
ncbi:RNA methyltransferase [Thalassotalea piscium]|uniref:tRNA(Leu) C34 or U34 (Ribose-2'-O)-methylase TrmL n=1 Tax=Thalassotalea piscium TaxID=1230533 RepID=A0A7X0TTK4_9GAMM|nr:RNA methyltransferase [Thalassotalea piscium]MBB6543347.1 tRNA(Leu) C34 or U34 (ribose-2'-O)-methylase TrmL [Thalassotalea piscium]